MNSTFTIASLVPSEESQSSMLREFRDASSPQARDRALIAILTEFGPYIRQIARFHWRRSGRGNREGGFADVEAAGRLGLLSAVCRWSPAFGKPFAHYASRWVAGSCKSEVRLLSQGAIVVPLKIRRLCREYRGLAVNAGEDLLRLSHSRTSTQRMVRYLSQAESPHPLSLQLEHPDGSVSEVLHADEPTPAVQAETSEQVGKLRLVLLQRCSARERLIFFLHFPHWPIAVNEIGEVISKTGVRLEPARIDLLAHVGNLVAIAGLLGLTRERIRQIHGATLKKLRLLLEPA